MKPRWHFVAGSLIGLFSLAGLGVGAVFLVNIIFFSLRRHGPMGQWRFEAMLNSFPWWIPAAATAGIVVSILLLKKYDFSYKKNFALIVIGFVASIIIGALLIDNLGLNEAWSGRGPMRRFYQQLEKNEGGLPRNNRWTRHGKLHYNEAQ